MWLSGAEQEEAVTAEARRAPGGAAEAECLGRVGGRHAVKRYPPGRLGTGAWSLSGLSLRAP